MNKKLSLVGSGIKAISHITKETEAHIKNANLVLYLVNDPLMDKWIQTYARNAQSLEQVYFDEKNRIDAYSKITDLIIACTKENPFVCVVIYGHPTIFAIPGLRAIKIAKERGIQTMILPGISAEDCLYADLMIDPGSCGCYSVEATDLLVFKRNIDVSSHLIIWQIGLIGNLGHERCINQKALKRLINYLTEYYPLGHDVVLYESSLYPDMSPKIVNCSLEAIPSMELSSITTLYIPPLVEKKADPEVLGFLGLK